LHLGATLAEISESERRAWHMQPPERPFVLFAQPSLLIPRVRLPVGILPGVIAMFHMDIRAMSRT